MEEINLNKEETAEALDNIIEKPKEKTKFHRWLEAVKSPSQESQVTTQIAVSIGIIIGLAGGSITLIMMKSYWFALATGCGSLLTLSGLRAMFKQLATIKNMKKIMEAK